MTEVNQKYPHGLSDTEIEQYIKIYAEEIFTTHGDINTVMWAAPMIHLGRAKLQSRALERGARFTKWVSYSSMAVAAMALIISIVNSWSSSRWEERQLQLLAALDQRLVAVDNSAHQQSAALDRLSAAINQARAKITEEFFKRDAANKSLERTRKR